jgi:ApaG protein
MNEKQCDIRIHVATDYIDDQSEPDADRYVFAYTITILQPGQRFRYSSGAVLETPVGAMHGLYRMETDTGSSFDAPIEPFTLAVPGLLH